MDPLPPPKVKKSDRVTAKRKAADLHQEGAFAAAMRPAHLSATEFSRQSRLAKLRGRMTLGEIGGGRERRGRGGAAPPNNEVGFELVVMDHGTTAGINMNKNISGTDPDPASDKVTNGPWEAGSHTLAV